MSEWKLHVPDEGNRLTHYQCGLIAGDRVRVKKEMVVTDHQGNPTGTIHSRGAEWTVLTSLKSDPVIWFRQPDGTRCTWDDDAMEIEDWFEKI